MYIISNAISYLHIITAEILKPGQQQVEHLNSAGLADDPDASCSAVYALYAMPPLLHLASREIQVGADILVAWLHSEDRPAQENAISVRRRCCSKETA